MGMQMARMMARNTLVQRIEQISADHRAVDHELDLLWADYEWHIPKIHNDRLAVHREKNRRNAREIMHIISAGTWRGLPIP